MTDVGWRFEIDIPPRVEKAPRMAFSTTCKCTVPVKKPHLEFPAENQEYKHSIKRELNALVESPFRCPVVLSVESYMDNARVQYPTKVAHAVAAALVPELIADPRLITEIRASIHYPPSKTSQRKTWKPRSVVTVEPIITNLESFA